jgi:hypothetical protein
MSANVAAFWPVRGRNLYHVLAAPFHDGESFHLHAGNIEWLELLVLGLCLTGTFAVCSRFDPISFLHIDTITAS